MADQDWAAEYQCYTTEFQNHLLYRVVLLALLLEFDMDLFLQAEEALERHGLTDADLEPFWPNGTSDTRLQSVRFKSPFGSSSSFTSLPPSTPWRTGRYPVLSLQ